jgi:hypothetical protein
MATLITRREFPQNYSPDIVHILRSMSFTDGNGLVLVGSASLRSQQYIGDYDGTEEVRLNAPTDEEALDILADAFRDIIKTLRGSSNIIIGDIKAGEIAEWRVFPEAVGVRDGKLVGYNAVALRARVAELKVAKVLTPAEAREYESLLVSSPTLQQFFVARDAIRPHIIRWTPAEVLQGYCVLSDGRQYTLQEAFSSHGITKLDVIGWISGNQFSEFSVLYQFFNRDRQLNPHPVDVLNGLREDIAAYMADGKPFKALKRRFALARLQNDTAVMERLQPILNGDLGRLYSLSTDIETILYLLEKGKGDMSKMHFELEQFRDRFAKIWSLKDFLYVEPALLGKLDIALRHPPTKAGAALMMRQLVAIKAELDNIRTKNTPTDELVGAGSPAKYFSGLSSRKKAQRKKEIAKFGAKASDDPAAYTGFKTDKGVTTTPSSFTKRFSAKFPEAKSLAERAAATGVPERFLKEVYDRGLAAWRTGHRPGASQAQWGFARVSSFLLGGPTYHTTDSDIVRKAKAASPKARAWLNQQG